MVHEERIDTIPKLKEAIQLLYLRSQGQKQVLVVLEAVRQLVAKFGRQAKGEDLVAFHEHLKGLVSIAKTIETASQSSKTGVYDLSGGMSEGLKPYMKDLLDKVNASLPNSFASDDSDSKASAQETISNLKLISQTAQLQQDDRVVDLVNAMLHVMEHHFADPEFDMGWYDRNSLVKPLLRGFALLRTAFEAPDEPNLQAALLDATADLQEHVIDVGNELSWESSTFGNSLAETTVTAEMARANQLGGETVPSEIETEEVNMRQTIAFSALSPIKLPDPIEGVESQGDAVSDPLEEIEDLDVDQFAEIDDLNVEQFDEMLEESSEILPLLVGPSSSRKDDDSDDKSKKKK